MPPLNPLLETDKIECLHKGKVIFQSSTKDLMCVQDSNGTDAGVINLQDLANAVIIGCTNNIAGIPNPCTKLVSIPNSITSSLLEIDNQKIVLAQAISQVITDKGSPLILQGEPKAKDILELDEDIVEFNNAQNTNESEKSISESSPKSSNQSNAGSNESNVKSSKDSSDSQSNADENKKSEIDLRVASGNKQGVEVKWISQYDTIQVDRAGDSACKRACEAIMSQLGIKVENPNSNNKVSYQVAIEKDMGYNTKSKTYQRDKNMNLTDTNKQNQDEYMQIDTQAFQDGLAYLDSELEKGYPIVVGVDHSYAYKGKGYNNDFATDHFVVIVGRKYDDKGKLYYLFYDVGTNHENKGTSDDNKLYIKNNQSLEGTSFLKNKDKTNKHYFVTQIRKNLSYK